MNKNTSSKIIFWFGVIIAIGVLLLKFFDGYNAGWTFASYMFGVFSSVGVIFFGFYSIAKSFEYFYSGLPKFLKAKELWFLLFVCIITIIPTFKPVCDDFCGIEYAFASAILVGGMVFILISRLVVRLLRKFHNNAKS